MIVPLALAHLIADCAPRVGPVTMNAVVMYESGGYRYAIGDNTVRRSYLPPDAASAETLARRLLRAGHNIDAGYAQVNSANFARLGLDARSVFAPCVNVAAGARILRDAYAAAARTYGPGQLALVHALSAYNTGGYWAGLGYARSVYATAHALRYARAERPAPSPSGTLRAVPLRLAGGAR
ncbi:MAG: lytic transglycosylase domain-containing protein [Candidatus Eremiobacteraeota bacterium]|nr:lytic transglycosylase domain-containing protein [Candidatus Eremiobacteraeota bacterium]MBC5802824.1 lytic transglycosylase domain-containing protein [Candidatus Eremiobacteraeota bacterium]MBC5821126.1 lytic transglycosylase domain-containing protein [Candidatus Eremiobacteraeota bacterium]